MRRLWALAPLVPVVVLRALRAPATRILARRWSLAVPVAGLIVRALVGVVLLRRALRRMRWRRPRR